MRPPRLLVALALVVILLAPALTGVAPFAAGRVAAGAVVTVPDIRLTVNDLATPFDFRPGAAFNVDVTGLPAVGAALGDSTVTTSSSVLVIAIGEPDGSVLGTPLPLSLDGTTASLDTTVPPNALGVPPGRYYLVVRSSYRLAADPGTQRSARSNAVELIFPAPAVSSVLTVRGGTGPVTVALDEAVPYAVTVSGVAQGVTVQNILVLSRTATPAYPPEISPTPGAGSLIPLLPGDSGTFVIPAQYQTVLDLSGPLFLISITSVTSGPAPALVYSNVVPLTISGPAFDPDDVTVLLTVNDGTGPVTITVDEAFSFNVSASGIPQGVVSQSALVLSRSATPPTSFTDVGVVPVSIGPSGTITFPTQILAVLQLTLPATVYLFGLTGVLAPGGSAPVYIASDAVALTIEAAASADAAPSITGLSSPLRTLEDTAVVTRFTVADDLSAVADLTVSLTGPAAGTVAFSRSGAEVALTYTPNPNVSGTDTFDVTISDGTTPTTRTVTVIVTPVNDRPTATDDTLPSVAEDTPTDIAFGDLTVNDSPGPLEAGIDTLTVTGVDSADGGTVVLIDGVVRFIPTPDYSGPVSFLYTVEDSGGLTATATASFTTTNVNDPPAIDDRTVPAGTVVEATGPGGAPVSFSSPSASDPDGDPVTVACVSSSGLPSGSTFPIGDTVVTCTTTDDGAPSLSDTASFTITVRDSTGPVLTLSGGVQDGRTYARRDLPPAPTCTALDLVDGPVVCTVSGYQIGFGSHTITYTATDRVGTTSTRTVTYTVAERAVGPTATPRPPQATATPRPTERPRATPTFVPPAPTATLVPTVPPARTATPVPTQRPTPRPRN